MLKTIGIQELETASQLPRRTIHFYVKEGLIPPPVGLGRGARYGWGHVDALALIAALKQSTHLRLEGIRQILDHMSPGEMRTWALDIKQGVRTASELAALHALGAGDVAGASDALAMREQLVPGDAPMAQRQALDDLSAPHEGAGEAADDVGLFEDRIGSADDDDRIGSVSDDEDVNAGLSRPRSLHAKRSLFGRLSMRKSRAHNKPETWERIRLADDLEIHFRDGVDGERRNEIDALVELARDMLEK